MKTMLIILTKNDVVNEFFSNEREDPVNLVVPNYSETRGDLYNDGTKIDRTRITPPLDTGTLRDFLRRSWRSLLSPF